MSEQERQRTSLRLFGFDFRKETSTSLETLIAKDENSSTNTENKHKSTNLTNASATSAEAQADRKFQCHYCCRIFPTSQALGGHQNAHKRERQQAKRAQFQTSMSVEGNRYNYNPFNNLYRLGSTVAPSSSRFEVATHYPSWVNGYPSLSSGTRFYNVLGSVSDPIRSNSVSNIWRNGVIGSPRQDRQMVSSSISSSNGLVQDKGVKDKGVSLDLHL